MNPEVNDSEPRRVGSFGQVTNTDSSLRQQYFDLAVASPPLVDNDIESQSVSEAGDIGDRAIHSNRYNGTGWPRFSVDILGECETVVPFPEDALKQLETPSPLSADAIFHSGDKRKENEKELPRLVVSVSCLIHLAVFAIPGVLTRYLMQKLFGHGVVGATSDESYMYLDLPSNMVGSFLMGWWGAVFKRDISKFSNQLAVGLTTGYLGSLTTFSAWNQNMVELSVQGQWVFAMLGFLIGLFLVAFSFIFGVDTAKGFKFMLKRVVTSSECGMSRCDGNFKVDTFRRHMIVIVVLLLMLGLLWGLSGTLMKKDFNSDSSGTQLWFGCIVGPFGVWIRFYLARLNGRGLGKVGYLKWIPFGTLIANVSAACAMAALATMEKEVKNKSFDTVASGLQFGLCGCLSTVSTFIAEFEAMRQSSQPWRAYVYALITIINSFSLSTLIYSVPAWTKGYD